MHEREEGWLQDVFKAASKRVDEWPEWKKVSEARRSGTECQEQQPPQIEAKESGDEQ